MAIESMALSRPTLGTKEVSEVFMLAVDELFKIYQRGKFSAGDLKC
jgi:hypothetical protein